MIDLLWHTDYYDQPLTGICEYEGEYAWYAIRVFGDVYIPGGPENWKTHYEYRVWAPTIYQVYRLTKFQLYREVLSRYAWERIRKTESKFWYKIHNIFFSTRDDYRNNKMIGAFSDREYYTDYYRGDY